MSPEELILLIIIVIIILQFKKRKKEKKPKSDVYLETTQLSLDLIKQDSGRYGEYCIYLSLKDFENSSAKFLFNLYIPKKDNETAEIDVLMICKKGIFIFESKNFSGWIFGSETQKKWYQTLLRNDGKIYKQAFYNPIMQNRSHIQCLKDFIGEDIPITRSIIVFSNRCTLKEIKIKSDNVSVIKLESVKLVVSAICEQIPVNLLGEDKVLEIYNRLYPYTQTSEEIKVHHIENIQSKFSRSKSRDNQFY